ncbi:MAG: MFS transporter [Actinomycetales bacterium]
MTLVGRPSGADIAAVDVATVQRRSVRVLAAGQGLGGIAVAGSLPAGSLLAASLSGSEAAAGLAQTAGVLGAALLALPLARLALVRGRRPSLTAGYGIGAMGAAVVIAAALLSDLALLLFGCLLVGVASAASYQARYAATDLAPPTQRGRALAWVVWAATIGAVLGPNLLGVSGQVGLALGLPRLAGPYVLCGVALAAATAVLFLLLRPDPYLLALRERASSAGPQAATTLRAGVRNLRGHPRAALGIAIIAIGHVVMVMVMVMTPVHMAHVDVSLTFIGLVISVHVAGMYALSPVVGWSVDRLGRIQTTVLGMVILAAACVIAGLAPADSVAMLGVGLFLLGLGWSCTLIAGSTMLTDDTPEAERPAVQGLADLVMNGVGALGGAVAGVIVLAASYGALCAAALVPIVGLAVAVALPACRQSSNTRSI